MEHFLRRELTSLLVVILLLRHSLANTCTCVPDQWEGILSSSEHEFDLHGGRTLSTQNDIFVHYDFTNKRFAVRDIGRDSSAIADYSGGFRYVVRNQMCHGIRTDEPMRKTCLPDNAEMMGEYTMGDLPVKIWQFMAPFNATMRTTVVQNSCMPISEELYIREPGYVSLTSSVYLNVQLGISDPSVFDPPESCVVAASLGRNGGKRRRRSRSEGHFDLLKALRNRLHTTN